MLSSPDVASTLDRINLSDRKFVLLAAAIAKANDEDLSTAPLSHSTVHRKRLFHRSVIASDVRQEFSLTKKAALVVHWDGKMMKNSTNHQDPRSVVDRLAVSITGAETEKILGIVKMKSGTGAAQASATFELLKLWEVSSEIIGMSFDTTASNTGSTNGACTLLEQRLQRNLLYFACMVSQKRVLLTVNKTVAEYKYNNSCTCIRLEVLPKYAFSLFSRLHCKKSIRC